MPIDLFGYDYGPGEQARKGLTQGTVTSDLPTVERLLQEVKTVDCGVIFGSDWSLLHQAAKIGHPGIVQLLLDKGANLHSSAFDDYAPLHAAATFGHESVVSLLLARGANINVEDYYLHTPLSQAAAHGCTDVVALLLMHGAEVNTKQLDGYTPLHEAAAGGHTSIIQLLLDAGADINAKTIIPPPLDYEEEEEEQHELDARRLEGEGFTPLHSAACTGHADSAEILLARGAKVNAVAMDKYTPLSLAQQFGRIKVVEIFKRLGAV